MMAAAKNVNIPAYARVNNSVRLEFEAEKRQERGLEYIVKDLLFGLFQLTPDKILALQDYHVRGVYDVTFVNKRTCLDFVRKLQQFCNHKLLDCVKVTPHYEEENLQTLVVKMYNPNLPQEDITSWLSLFCDKVKFLHKITNSFGLWTGKRKYLVSFKKDILPPARFSIGKHNGDLFFDGMGSFCRICHVYGHTTELCKERHRCRNCDSFEHETLACPKVKRCNFCLCPGHVYLNCPHRSNPEKSRQAAAANPEVKLSSERENSAGPAPSAVDLENPAAGLTSDISEAKRPVKAESSASHHVSVSEEEESVLEKMDAVSSEGQKGKEQHLKSITKQSGRSREGKQALEKDKSPVGEDAEQAVKSKAKKQRTGSPAVIGARVNIHAEGKSWAEVAKSSASKDLEKMEPSPLLVDNMSGDLLFDNEIPIDPVGLASPKQDFLNTDLVFQLMGMDPLEDNMDF